jgi:hypothetical protein
MRLTMRGWAGVLRIALIGLVPLSTAMADVIYDFVQNLPGQFAGDQPTATWTFDLPSFATVTGYVNGPQGLDAPPTFNAAAVADGYLYVSGDAVMHASDDFFAGVDPTSVVFALGGVDYLPQANDPCAGPQSNTVCTITGLNNYIAGTQNVSGFAPDTLTIITPEPAAFVSACCSCLMAGLLVWAKRSRLAGLFAAGIRE